MHFASTTSRLFATRLWWRRRSKTIQPPRKVEGPETDGNSKDRAEPPPLEARRLARSGAKWSREDSIEERHGKAMARPVALFRRPVGSMPLSGSRPSLRQP